MNIIIILQMSSLIISFIALLVVSVSLWSLIRPVYITDYSGNERRAMIRMAERIPNNGLLYRYKHSIKQEFGELELREIRKDWINENQEEYYDMLNQRNSEPPYDNVKVRYG